MPNKRIGTFVSEFFSRRYELIWEGTFINFHLGPKVNKNICIFSYLNMFILINIYFVWSRGGGLFTPSSQGGISIQRGTSIRGGTFIYF